MIKLALDFDSVIANTTPIVLEVVSNYIDREVHANELENFHLTKCFGISSIESHMIVNEICNLSNTLKMEPISGSIDFINHWIATENELTIITARHDTNPVKLWLHFNGVDWDNELKIIGDDHTYNKGEICRQLNITHMIDDHLENVYNIANYGVVPIIFKQIWNTNMLSKRSLINQIAVIVDTWDEIFYLLKNHIYKVVKFPCGTIMNLGVYGA
jgi:uncharacterized protein